MEKREEKKATLETAAYIQQGFFFGVKFGSCFQLNLQVMTLKHLFGALTYMH